MVDQSGWLFGYLALAITLPARHRTVNDCLPSDRFYRARLTGVNSV